MIACIANHNCALTGRSILRRSRIASLHGEYTSSCKGTIVICYTSNHTSTLSQRHNEVIALTPEIIHCYECNFYKLFPFHTKPQVGWSQLVLLIKIKTIV